MDQENPSPSKVIGAQTVNQINCESDTEQLSLSGNCYSNSVEVNRFLEKGFCKYNPNLVILEVLYP